MTTSDEMVKCPLKSAQKLNMSSHSGLGPNVECETWHAVLRKCACDAVYVYKNREG